MAIPAGYSRHYKAGFFFKDSDLSGPYVIGPDGSPVLLKSANASSSVTITRPSDTTAYTAGDAIGQSSGGSAGSAILEFANIGAAGGDVLLTSASLRIHLGSIPSGMSGMRLHLYDSSPDAILDNAAWTLSSAGDRGKYQGFVDLFPAVVGATLYANADAINRHIRLVSTSLYGVMQTLGAYTPASGTVYVPRVMAIGL